MLKRQDYLVTFAVTALVSAFAATASDRPARAVAAKPADAQARALTSAQRATLTKLERLGAPDAKYAIAAGVVGPALKPMAVKKEISCGVWVYPPTPNPMAGSQRLYFVNNTGQLLPGGFRVEWQVEGAPAACCHGTTGPLPPLPPNPPTVAYAHTNFPVLNPPQSWTRPCKAWAILP